MSHFTCFVVIPSNQPAIEVSEKDAAELLVDILAPYDEEIEVAPYEKPCYCIGLLARGRARKSAESRIGPFDTLRTDYWEKVRQGELVESQDTWKAMVAPYVEAEEQAYNADPDRDNPDPDCSECQGTGITASTYNPKSHWDWYVIGGRWNGMFTPSYDVEKDPRNYEHCDLCDGTGKRNDRIGREARREDPTYSCNGCDGKGTKLKYSSHWVHPVGANIADPKAILGMIEAGEKVFPFAMLTPGEGWVEKASMGWFGMTSNDKEAEVWKASVVNLLKKYEAGHIVVNVDCHI